jgi:hypothetical protein
MIYDDAYDNAQFYSDHFFEHMRERAAYIIRRTEALDGSILEVGCGQGTFLDMVDWIMEKRATYDFFYEHGNYFTQKTLAFTLSLAGFSGFSIDLLFGDQYLWAESSVRSGGRLWHDQEFIARAEVAACEFSRMEAERLRLVHDLAPKGLGIWGAGAKGVTFASILDPEASKILIDINPQRQRAFIAGTGHQIVDAEHAWDLGVRSVLVMNPNYVNEVRKLTEASNLAFQVSSVDSCHA